MTAANETTTHARDWAGRAPNGRSIGGLPDPLSIHCASSRPPNTAFSGEAPTLAPASSAATRCWTAPSLECRNGHDLLLLPHQRSSLEHGQDKLPITLVEDGNLLTRQRCHMQRPDAVGDRDDGSS